MVEQRRGVMPPQARGPEPRRTPRSVIVRRRVVAIGVLIVALVGAWIAVAGVRHSTRSKPAGPAAARKPFRVVFPEGFTRKDMARRLTAVDEIAHRERGVDPVLSASQYLRLTGGRRLVPRVFGRQPPNLEGFLFPATYDFTAQTTSAQLVRAQLRAFFRNWRQVNLSYASSKNLTRYDVLIIASMVEKEALAPEERSKIARVIYNRLHAHMYLGIDATIRYGLNVPGTRSLTVSELNSSSPYNTRNHYGLTPTPIANPGLASIQAAAHPAPGNWLYFVRKPDHVHHFFTASYDEFRRYEREHGYR